MFVLLLDLKLTVTATLEDLGVKPRGVAVPKINYQETGQRENSNICC